MSYDVLVIAPFRRPVFRKMISSAYPVMEPWDSAPLSVAAALESAGLRVGYLALQNVFDAWNEERDAGRLRELLAAVPARTVVFASDYFIPSRSTATLFGMRITSRLVREMWPASIIGVTGRLATTAWTTLLAEPGLCDFLVYGEPEPVVADIVTAVVEKGIAEAEHPSLLTAPLAAAGHVPVAVPHDLDSVPAPAWHLVMPSIRAWDGDRPHSGQDIPFSLRTSAGCRFRCRFCAGVPNWLNYRTKSAARVAEELDTLVEATGGRGRLTFLEDEVFTRDSAHVSAVAGVFVERGLKVDGVYTHSSMVSPSVAEVLATMARKVYLGLDNPDDSVLRDMRKGQRLANVLAAVETARKAGLGTHLEWIVGAPPESADTVLTSLNAIVSLLSTGAVESVNSYVYCPHPGTEYAEQAESFGFQVIDGFEEMQESGGYPSAGTSSLNQAQVFTAYLMSQLAIAETVKHREIFGPTSVIGTANRAEFGRLIDKVGGLS